MAKRKPTTWLELAVSTGGFRHGIKAMRWALMWGVAREALGQEPSVEEVGDYWHSSRRTAFRDQAAFRKAFPSFETPAPMFESEAAQAQVGRLAQQFQELAESLRSGTPRLDAAVMQLGMLGPA